MLKSYKYRLYPTQGQQSQIEAHFGCCRLVWNLALAAKQQAYSSNRVNLTRFDLQNQLLELKKEYRWLYEANAQSLQSVLLHLDNSYKSFFKGGGFPKYKNKRGRQSFQCPQDVIVDFKMGTVKIPKIWGIKANFSRQFTGQIKTCTVSRTSTDKYFISILVDNKSQFPQKKQVDETTTIGIDVGISNYVVSSDGRVFEPNRKLKENLKRLKVLQRRAFRKKKGSVNRRKANLRTALLHEKISNQRFDYIHKITTELTRDSQVETIVVENLNVVGMLQNRNLAQAISDASFGELFRTLEYKCTWKGKNFIKIGRFDPSSKKCSNCGKINKDLKLSDREWLCDNCGTEHDRDHNAAVNIKYFGLQKINNSPVGSQVEPAELSALVEAKKQENVTKHNHIIINH